MDNRDHQILSQTTALKQQYNLLLVAGILAIIFFSGIIGFFTGARVEKNLYSQLIPTPTPILLITAIPTPRYTPPSSSGVPAPAEGQLTPLKSTQDLPFIASAVLDWVVKHQPSPNPQISFTENDGKYAEGLLGDLTQAGGEGWFAAKINGSWTIAYVGQSSPKCSDVVQYHLPQNWLPCASSP